MMTLYHGTTTALNIDKTILPSTYTGVLREDFRKKDLGWVWLTDSTKSAAYYAKKAVAKYGGEPIIYIVKPIPYYIERKPTEYICQKARVLGRYEK